MNHRKHTLHEVRWDSRIFEVYAPNAKDAQAHAQYRKWATSPYHEGIRRILRIVAGEPWPVLQEEAAYITALRNDYTEKRALEAGRQERQASAERRRLERAAVEAAESARRDAAAKAWLADRREKRLALRSRLEHTSPFIDVPMLDPDTNEWI